MSKTDSPPRTELHAEPLLTLHVSHRAGWMVLAALAIIAALIVLDIRSRNQSRPVASPKATVAGEPAPTPFPPTTAKEPKPQKLPESKPAEDPTVNIASSSVTIHRESAPVEVSIQPPAANEPAADISELSVVPVAPVVLKTNGPVSLNGAGATFPNAIYTKWFSEFHRLHPGVEINYQAIGSGGGIRQVLAGTVDFGASDGPMTDEQLGLAHVKIAHIPTVLGAVVPIYNVPGAGEIRFTPEILTGIFMGQITSWNHPWIVHANRHVNLPSQPIIVVHRSDGNGTTFTFTDYLSKVSAEWQSQVGKGTSVRWPIGLGGKGNEGVAGQVRQLQGAIGYVDLTYALLNNLRFGSVRNSSGAFVKANFDSVTDAAASLHGMPADFRVSITNAPGTGAYPISTFTWLLVPQRMQDADRGQVMASFLRWMINDGEAMAKPLGYAPLPNQVARQVRKTISQLR